MNRWLFASTLLLLASSQASTARAFCVEPALRWTTPTVDVFLVTSGVDSVANIGLPVAEVRNQLRAALAQWDSASGGNVTLRFAGEVSDSAFRAGAVTVFSSCMSCCDSPTAAACVPFIGASSAGTRINLRPIGCEGGLMTLGVEGWSTSPNQSRRIDTQAVLAHELGHALGLRHPDDERCAGNDTTGIMNGALFDTVSSRSRWLRRDDIMGLRALYGTRNRNILSRTSSDGATWGPETVFSSSPVDTMNRTRTPLAATDGANASDDGPHYIAWVDSNDRVRHIGGDWSSWNLYSGGIDGVTTSRTYDAPAIAQGPGTLAVAWIAHESLDSFEVTIRWGVWWMTEPGFRFFDGPVTTSKSFGLAYVPRLPGGTEPAYLLTYLDSESVLHALTIDHRYGSRVADVSTGVVRHEAGDAACRPGRCSIPAATGAGMCTAWIAGPVVARRFIAGGPDISHGCYRSHASMDLAEDQRTTGPVTQVGTFTQADERAWLYRMMDAGPPQDMTSIDSDYWPIAVGAMNRFGTEVRFRTYYAR